VEFLPDPIQARVLEHPRGAMLVTGSPGTGKTTILRERLARLIEEGADPERVALVVGSRRARADARADLLRRMRSSLPGLRILTVHGLAYHVVGQRFEALGYDGPPDVLSASDQFARVQELLSGEDPADWPAYGGMLRLRGFADQVRQFLLRAQEALLKPEDVQQRAAARGLTGWDELAAFYRRYLQVLDDTGAVDFAGLVEQASVAASQGPAPYDHILVDDYQDSTFAAEALVIGLGAESLVVAGDVEAHVFSFQGTTDVPIRQFLQRIPTGEHVKLATRHRGSRVELDAWDHQHSSEEHAGIARELRRIHVDEGVPWGRLAIVVRRQGTGLGGLLRALDDARVPRWTPQRGLSTLAEPATYPYVLALRWVARPEERAALVEPLVTSDLARVPPAAARGMLRAAGGAGVSAETVLAQTDGLSPEQVDAVAGLRAALDDAAQRAGSVVDAFSVLWRRLPSSTRLVDVAQRSAEARRDLDAVVALADLVTRAGEGADPSVETFLSGLEAGEEGPGWQPGAEPEADAVAVLTAHGSVGREFDTVIVAGAVEGNFPSLSRPEPMFDLSVLDASSSQAQRNRMRLADERRLFGVVVGRAARRVLFTSSEVPDEEGPSGRSRFVDEVGVRWQPAPVLWEGEPLTVDEAAAAWRRRVSDRAVPPSERSAALEGLIALRVDPSRWWYQRDWTGTARPLHEHLRTSYSRLDTLENCELQFVLSEELGLGSPSGYHAWVGTLVHRLIEEVEEGLIDRSLEAMRAAVQARWRQQEFPSFAVSEAFRRLVLDVMLPNWFDAYADRPAVDREVRFEFPFEGATISGYIDRIGEVMSGGYRITDYKTGKADNAGDPQKNLQLGIYYLGVNQTPELEAFRPVRGVELAFVRGKRTDPHRIVRAQWQPSMASEPKWREEMTERLAGLVGRLRELYENEVYRPSTAADCHFCEFKSLCSLWPQGAPVFPECEISPARLTPDVDGEPVPQPTGEGKR
jgi:superfamily I DNA/RNA helicase/RecB family exonuclease